MKSRFTQTGLCHVTGEGIAEDHGEESVFLCKLLVG